MKKPVRGDFDREFGSVYGHDKFQLALIEWQQQTLNALCEQIAKCDPVDSHGHRFVMNAAYLAAIG